MLKNSTIATVDRNINISVREQKLMIVKKGILNAIDAPSTHKESMPYTVHNPASQQLLQKTNWHVL